MTPVRSADSDYDRSTLLHELVHVVQYTSREWRCDNAAEWEAYKLQSSWLEQHEIIANFNWNEIQLLSNCIVRDIHPSTVAR